MGNGYFRASQTSSTRQRDAKRNQRSRDSFSYQHNYVDRVRFEGGDNITTATHIHDPRCPQLRAAAGWRHSHKSISHLDLATSCHDAAGSGLDRRHHSTHHSHSHSHSHLHSHSHHSRHPHSQLQLEAESLHPHAQPHWTQCRVGGQLRNARSLDYTQLEREENALDIAEFYWRFDAEAADGEFAPISSASVDDIKTIEGNSEQLTVKDSVAATATFYDFGSESCSLRRSRSLAVIREETFSDLQISSANSSRRRSQLIPRARLVNRGFFRESPTLSQHTQSPHRLNCKSTTTTTSISTIEREGGDKAVADDTITTHSSHSSGHSGTGTCDSHQQQQLQKDKLLKQQQQQQLQQQQLQQQQLSSHHHCHHPRHQQLTSVREARDFDVYYDNLKRLDALALGLGAGEQLHPWHNDKSDLESLNSEYFKNSLHQSHEQQQQPSSLEFEALEQAVTLLSESRPRIYQSRRQRQQYNRHHHCHQRHTDTASAEKERPPSGTESCPEHSQSSIFPETTTSNSDDQTDSPSLSEQEYDVSRIEQIFQQTQLDGIDIEASFDLISLTTTRTQFESSSAEEDEDEVGDKEEIKVGYETAPTETEEGEEADSETGTESTLKRTKSEQQLETLIAYDSVYLSSEDSSDCTLIGESTRNEQESHNLLHITIEDPVYEPQKKQTTSSIERGREELKVFTQVLKVEQPTNQSNNPTTNTSSVSVGVTSSAASKPKILSVVEKRKLRSVLAAEDQTDQRSPLLKRQVTDPAVILSHHKSNLATNQYHSLPDVNIGQSLNVSECIDAELRSSYNLQRQQRKEAATATTSSSTSTTRQLSHLKRQRTESEEVTRDEIHDSIRRFGRAHQKARQREFKEHQEQQQQLPQPPKDPKDTEAKCRQSEVLLSTQTIGQVAKETTPLIEVTNFTKLIERRAREIHTRQSHRPDFRIIVTDAQNNIIEQQAIAKNENKTQQQQQHTTKAGPSAVSASVTTVTHRSGHPLRRVTSTRASDKPPERRVLSSSTPIYKARPAKVLTTSDSFRQMSRPQILHVVDNGSGSMRRRSSSGGGGGSSGVVTATSTTANDDGGTQATNEYLQKVDAVRCYWSRLAAGEGKQREKPEAKPAAAATTMRQFQLGETPTTPKKTNVSSSNSTTTATTTTTTATTDYCSFMPSIEIVELGEGAPKAAIVSANVSVINAKANANNNVNVNATNKAKSYEGHDKNSNSSSSNSNNNAKDNNVKEDDDDDDDEDDGGSGSGGSGGAQFDHIRYKVLKSQQLLRSNIRMARNKKEAQFDGLIQYLQEYSFQELLSNNNVVIVEPVRTKIEKPMTVSKTVCGLTTNAALSKRANPSVTQHQQPPPPPRASAPVQHQRKNRLKRHFFYQPVRVNRELYEDELPDPDTVRNARLFFEQNVLPTPGEGLLVRSQKFGGSACQLSPKTQRCLTIDTGYGHGEEQPKGMEQLLEEQQQLKAKHWDTASLSSGISSGDLSSPCGECHAEVAAATAAPKESPLLACKDVRVQEVVRRHNSNAANAKTRTKVNRHSTGVGVSVGAGASGAGDSLYRQIYEHNLGQANEATTTNANNRQRQRQSHGFLECDDNDDDDDDDNDDDDDDDHDEQDMCESYYVSNDVLAKIRECGSTVTYYGGRVLERTAYTRVTMSQPREHPPPSMARTRVRQIEACNVCQPEQCCNHQLQTMDHDSYQGIKFKLVKSNSCSSRLELAGTTDEGILDRPLETEMVVRKMVHQFENIKPEANEFNLTINSQCTEGGKQADRQQQQQLEQERRRRQVTVNNHINVLSSDSCNDLGDIPTSTTEEIPEPEMTYQSQALDIRLDVNGKCGAADKPNNTNNNSNKTNSNTNTNSYKVSRNKNVDLAYTLASKQTPPMLSPMSKHIAAIPGIANSNQCPQGQKIGKQFTESKTEPNSNSNKNNNRTTEAEEILSRPQQIIVPIEQQQQQQQTTQFQPQRERRLSNASSSNASIVDKTVVRHYVANDKSLFEKRKYDEIEFEEFEVYDPVKEALERSVEDNQLKEKKETNNTDGELYDSLDDKL